MPTQKTLRILLTSGEPAGIGPELVVQIAQKRFPVELIVIADPELLASRAKALRLPLQLLPFEKEASSIPTSAQQLKIIPLSLKSPSKAGVLAKENAPYVIQMLQRAAQEALEGSVDAIVTAPVQKSILNEAGFSFQGHTEFFADCAGVKETVMLFVMSHEKKPLRVALVTIHIPLARVPAELTAEKLENTLRILRQGLIAQFNIADPLIYVCGLNPHAGESGFLGREEIDIMASVFKRLTQEGFKLRGPLSADTIFTGNNLEKADAFLAMYHDQALPVVKTLSFGKAVNVTLGLPFIRTSVDHGPALDLAGTGRADPGSLQEAIEVAIQIAKEKK